MTPHLQQILHEITVRITKLEEIQQPQRTWVGLTFDERLELAQDVDWAAGAYCEYAEKVEAKLKEKNT